MKIYTKFGDTGDTALFDGKRVPKDHLRIETYGTVDELNSCLGIAIAALRSELPPVPNTHARETHAGEPPLHERLLELQRELFVLGSDLATPPGSKHEDRVKRIAPEAVQRLERWIDRAAAQLPPLKRFVLPGGTPAAAHLHLARTLCRRAERRLVALIHADPPAAPALATPLIYLNRLSDLLFTLARLANKDAGIGDIEWDGRNNMPV
ncbi:MAG TPA: cob(I)yrinic acid a,c-diamide adenosyltransferase [Phycisphaerae bacterium]|nr:cob(I)yrinic acid a,c-diamide adenosyltransferase [Phycisphaerae bacterium]